MIRKAFLLMLLLIVTACGSGNVALSPTGPPPRKVERELSQMLMRRPDANDRILNEDRWFVYELELERVVKSALHNTNTIFGECRYAAATYKVIDKETGAVVRDERIAQQPCNKCHNR